MLDDTTRDWTKPRSRAFFTALSAYHHGIVIFSEPDEYVGRGALPGKHIAAKTSRLESSPCISQNGSSLDLHFILVLGPVKLPKLSAVCAARKREIRNDTNHVELLSTLVSTFPAVAKAVVAHGDPSVAISVLMLTKLRQE
jgi:hypothetical protein